MCKNCKNRSNHNSKDREINASKVRKLLTKYVNNILHMITQKVKTIKKRLAIGEIDTKTHNKF
ncbi:hypothetical protein GCM10011368_23460 [Hyunsoonleella pacifica]|nr:hypothetical protein GCM10011368_23460 [Hyunsoonleella pacifica]